MSEPLETISTAADLLSCTTAESIVVTIPVSDAMHSRVAAICERRGVDIATVIEDLLERHFPAQIVATVEPEEAIETTAGTQSRKVSWRMRLILRQRKSR